MKYLYRLVLMILALMMLTSMSVYAATVTLGGVEVDENLILQPVSGKYTVTYNESIETELTAGQQIVLLVVKGVATTPAGLTISADTIRYIDQAVPTDTSITFSNFVPSSIPNCTVLISGLAGVDGPKIVGYIEAGKVTVDGSLTINGRSNATVKLTNSYSNEYLASTTEASDSSQIVTFSIPLVPIDTYQFEARKNGHTSYTIASLEVSEFGATIANVKLYGGDITQNENINVYDLADLLIDFGKVASSAKNPLSDITENGHINVYDLAELLINFGKQSTIIS